MGHADRAIAVGQRLEHQPAGLVPRLFDGGEFRVRDRHASQSRDVDRAAIRQPGQHDDLLAVAGRVELDGGWIDIDGHRVGGQQAIGHACQQSQSGNESQRLRSHQRPSFFSVAAASVGSGFEGDFGGASGLSMRR